MDPRVVAVLVAMASNTRDTFYPAEDWALVAGYPVSKSTLAARMRAMSADGLIHQVSPLPGGQRAAHSHYARLTGYRLTRRGETLLEQWRAAYDTDPAWPEPARKPLPDPIEIMVDGALHFLAMRGAIDPDPGEHPDDIRDHVRNSYVIHQAQIDGHTMGRASALADWYLVDLEDAWWESLPRWRCPCGQNFVVLQEQPGIHPRAHEFTRAGLRGVVFVADGGTADQVDKRCADSGPTTCPACGRGLAHTVTHHPAGQLALH